MSENISILSWLEKWYLKHCDGEWEHDTRIRISTLDNPGWAIMINLDSTEAENLIIGRQSMDNGDEDWYDYIIENKLYIANGDATKLELLINKFREIIERNN